MHDLSHPLVKETRSRQPDQLSPVNGHEDRGPPARPGVVAHSIPWAMRPAGKRKVGRALRHVLGKSRLPSSFKILLSEGKPFPGVIRWAALWEFSLLLPPSMGENSWSREHDPCEAFRAGIKQGNCTGQEAVPGRHQLRFPAKQAELIFNSLSPCRV